METDAVTDLLRQVAEQVIRPRFRALDDAQVDEKAPGDLVTVADREAEERITAALRGAYPGAVILGEETAAARPELLAEYAAAEHAFTVDPVDGTRNFVHGSPDHAVMVAELRSGLVVRGWIWQPEHDVAYVAERGAGAYRNGVRMSRPAMPTGDPAGATSRRGWVGHRFGALPPLVLSWASCGIDYPRLAEGAVDYLAYWTTKPWDHAPGSLLLTELGGVVRTPDGTDYDPRRAAGDGLLATTSPTVFDTVTPTWPPRR